MPSLTFVLPHWLYWAALLIFPLMAIWLVRRERGRADAGRPNLFLAFLFLVTAGFVGMHRFYLRNAWGLVFLPLFLAVVWTSAGTRDAREQVSEASFAVTQAERQIARAESSARRRPEGAEQRIAEARAEAAGAAAQLGQARAAEAGAALHARIAAILLALAILGDAFLLPGLVRRARAAPPPPAAVDPLAVMEAVTAPSESTGAVPAIDRLVRWTGELSAYWSVIAVFVYYYEVVGRYLFNSPTNWVHESMFLMFGMQYMLAGAYAYRDETHVRVDIVYSRLSRRGRAFCDVITSAFFFLFVGTMLVTGWRFAGDAIEVGESSFTEWGIQYWPVKLAIPIGAALLLLQGFSRLLRDISLLARKG